jgi:hypothetical protein
LPSVFLYESIYSGKGPQPKEQQFYPKLYCHLETEFSVARAGRLETQFRLTLATAGSEIRNKITS